jgi:hypothetical protein
MTPATFALAFAMAVNVIGFGTAMILLAASLITW